MPRHGGGGSRGRGRGHHKRRYDEQYDGGGGEESVDDLLVASMHAAAASSWCEPAPAVDDSSESDASDSGEDSGESSSSEEESSSSSEDEESQGGDEVIREDKTGASGTATADAEENVSAAGKKPTDANDGGKDDSSGCNKKGAADEHQAKADNATKDAHGDEGDVSDVDLAEQPPIMEENDSEESDESDDEALSNISKKERLKNTPSNKNSNNDVHQRGPRTENEVDPYSCPTDELKRLNVGTTVDTEQFDQSLKVNSDGSLVVDDNIKKKLQLAGTIRSYVADQRTVVVDSLIPSALQNSEQCHGGGVITSPLDEGSMLVVVTKQIMEDGEGCLATSLSDAGENQCSLQILGKIMEVFGPVQRPIYAIRLPDKPKAKESAKTKESDKKPEINAKAQDPLKNDDEIELDEDDKVEAMAKEEGVEDTSDPTPKDDIDESAKEKMNSESDVEKKESSQSTDGTEKTIEDPWSPKGKLSLMLKSCPNAVVYSLTDHAKLINTDHVIKMSGKGCDASNIYDEELGPGEDEYFSDDEQERLAKRGNRKRHPQQSNNDQRVGASSFNEGRDGRGGRGGGGRDGRGRGRGGRGGRGRGYSQHHSNGSHGPPQHHMQQPQYRQGYPQPYHQQSYHNSYPPQQPMQQMMSPNPAYPYQQGHQQQQQYQQGMYQQQQQYQQQYHQPQHYQQQQHPYYGGQPYQHAVHQGQAAYGVPPPPPPGNAPAQMVNAQYAQQPSQPSQEESDTVYYDYSGA